jgi:hypothetical protein
MTIMLDEGMKIHPVFSNLDALDIFAGGACGAFVKKYSHNFCRTSMRLSPRSGLEDVADFEVSVAASPETHAGALSPGADLDNLQRKLAAPPVPSLSIV